MVGRLGVLLNPDRGKKKLEVSSWQCNIYGGHDGSTAGRLRGLCKARCSIWNNNARCTSTAGVLPLDHFWASMANR